MQFTGGKLWLKLIAVLGVSSAFLFSRRNASPSPQTEPHDEAAPAETDNDDDQAEVIARYKTALERAVSKSAGEHQ